MNVIELYENKIQDLKAEIAKLKQPKERLTNEQIDAMFFYHPTDMHSRVRQLEYRNVAKTIRDLLQGAE